MSAVADSYLILNVILLINFAPKILGLERPLSYSTLFCFYCIPQGLYSSRLKTCVKSSEKSLFFAISPSSFLSKLLYFFQRCFKVSFVSTSIAKSTRLFKAIISALYLSVAFSAFQDPQAYSQRAQRQRISALRTPQALLASPKL